MAHDVFISYSHTDKPTADAACATLESRGIRCWIAPRDVLPGDEYASALVGAIHSSRLLVLVFSSGANQSPQVLREVERAVSKGLPILPLRIEDVAPSAAMEYYISSRHWLDALTTPLEQHLVQLADTVTLLLARSAGGSPPAAPASAVRPVPPPVVEPSPVESATAAAPPKPAPAPPDPRLVGRGRLAMAALIIIAVLASMRGWETILMPVFGWSNTRLTAMSLVRLVVLVLTFAAGGIRLRTTSPRTLATIAGLLFGGGMMLLVLAAASPLVPLAAVILTAAGTGLGCIVAISALMTWFPGRRGMVAGLAALAFGLGGFGQRTLVTWFGFIALPTAGLLSLVFVLIAARALQFPVSAGAGTAPSRTLREAFGSPVWRTLWVLLFLNTAIGWSIAYRPPGFGMTDPGTAPRIFTLLAAFGSLLWPMLSDRFGARRILLLVIGGQALFLFALSAAHADVLVLLTMLLNGGGLGLMPVLAADAFGTEDFGAVYGLLLSGWCLALQAAPAFLWWGSDRGRAGVAALLLLGAVVTVHRVLRPPARA